MKLNPDQWRRMREVLDAALKLPIDERAAYLDRIGRDEPEIRVEVEAMLAHEQESEDILRPPQQDETQPTSRTTPSGLPSGTQIGPYEIDCVIGSGGMSVVYRASQSQPERYVALKMLRPSLATHDTLKRFQFEAEFLGRLSHPNVAHVYEAGLWSEGEFELPWLALEFVSDAQSITAFAREHDLSIAQKLELFLAVCDAVHHGHQKGVVHRDLKPGNLLVDDQGRVKVIDFGIARLTSLSETANITQAGVILGTLAYMAPEQFDESSDDVDVRSDVYALGVVLFELIAGELPLDLDNATITEVVLRVREREPRSLRNLVPNAAPELEWITSKCLSKEPERRYASASELAADIQRVTRNEPVQAGPPSKLYAFSKFTRRHRTAVFSAAVLLVVLIAWGVSGNLLLIRARDSDAQKTAALAEKELALADKQQALVEKQAALVEKEAALFESDRRLTSLDHVKRFLDDTLLAISPSRWGREARLIDVLHDTAEKLAAAENMQPEIGLELHDSLGRAFFGLGEFDAAASHFELALSCASEAVDVFDDEIERIRINLAQTYFQLSRYDEAATEAREVFDIRVEALGLNSSSIAAPAIVIAKTMMARSAYDEAVEFLEPLSAGEAMSEVLIQLDSVRTQILLAKSQLHEARNLGEDVLARVLDFFGTRHPETIEAKERLSEVLMALRENAQAHEYLKDAYALRLELYGPDSPVTWRTANNLSVVLGYLGRRVEQEAILRDCLPRLRAALGEEHDHVLDADSNLASCLAATGQFEEALPLYRDVLARTGLRYGEQSSDFLIGLNNLARAYERAGELNEASAYYGDLESRLSDVLGDQHYLSAVFRLNHGRLLVGLEQYDEARPLLEAAHRAFLPIQGAQGQHVRTIESLHETVNQAR